MTNPHTLDIPIEAIEMADEAARCPLGFEQGHVKRLIETLTRTGREYRQWCFEDAANGNLSRAWRYHKMAEQNLSSVKWWLARIEQESIQ